MVGIVVITHGKLADELISAVKFVLAEEPSVNIKGVSIDQTKEFETFKNVIQEAINSVDDGDGVLLVTDMFGGTPSNVSLSFLEKNKVEVISGVNLPMLLKLSTIKDSKKIDEIVKIAEKAGKENIIVASELLNEK